MSKAKYTRGPWTISHRREDGKFVIECETEIRGKVVPGIMGIVATVGYEPNAILIEAAPDMANALETLADTVAFILSAVLKKLQPGFAEIERVARTALRKAGIE